MRKRRDTAPTKDSPTTCRVKGCGRPTYSSGHCQSHHRQKTEGKKKLTTVRGYHRRDPGSVKYGTLRLTAEAAARVAVHAKQHDLAPTAALAAIVEKWVTWVAES